MTRGGYGKPWRKPANGWFVPPRVYFGGPYQQLRPALNGIARWQNTTNDTPLQPGLFGRPLTRPSVDYSNPLSSCESHPDNGLPKGPWIGAGGYLLSELPNRFTQNGTVDFGRNPRKRGFKNVQAARQWHGAFGWLSHDGGSCPDTICLTPSADYNGRNPGDTDYVATYVSRAYESPQLTPSQTKYLTVTVAAVHDYTSGWFSGNYVTRHSTASGSVSVDALSGKITNTLSTTEIGTSQIASTNGGGVTTYGPVVTIKDVANGTGDVWLSDGTLYAHYPTGATTLIDSCCALDVRCGHVAIPGTITGEGSMGLLALMDKWNAAFPLPAILGMSGTQLPAISDPNNYNATGTLQSIRTNDNEIIYTESLTVAWSRTDTVYTWHVHLSRMAGPAEQPGPGGPFNTEADFSGTLTLGQENTSAGVNSDSDHLLSFWPLNDDALYPPRTDGVWQVAPLVTRDEREGNVSPLTGFLPHTKDDYRSPIADANGNAPFSTAATPGQKAAGGVPADSEHPAVDWVGTWTQMTWFDDGAYGFRFAEGQSPSTAAATSFVQYALTGKIFGMPMPLAFTSSESALQGIVAGGAGGAGAYQNFFDFRATVWKCCDFIEPDTGSHQVDWYEGGYGEWLYDAITRTGAQLPHNATQWTNNFDAYNKPPYAYRIQDDQQIYTGPPDTRAHRADALWSQKCMEFVDLWPSLNFFRPTGADRFLRDETKVNCITADDGGTLTVSDVLLCAVGDTLLIAGSAGGDGIYQCAAASSSFNTITRGTFIRPLPAGFTIPTAGFVAVLRWPNCPAILGRAFIRTLEAVGSSTRVTVNSDVGKWLATGDTVDFCSTAITYDAHGNRVSEAMTAISSNQSITWIDDQHFTVPVALATVNAAQYIVSHGAPQWFWDDTGRKGDFVTLEWLLDYRTNGESARLGTGTLNCAGGAVTVPPNNGFASFAQTQYEQATGVAFSPCCPMVIAITPNGETWANASVRPLPALAADARYGARWQMEVETVMTDPLWQAPVKPCDQSVIDPLTDTEVTNIVMEMDDGTCKDNYFDYTSTGPGAYHIVYAHPTLFEARITVPNYGGNNEDETAPTPPGGIGYLSPVSNAGGIQPPGMIGFDVTSGNPSAAWTPWGYRLTIENGCTVGCRFNYVDAENLDCFTGSDPTPDAP